MTKKVTESKRILNNISSTPKDSSNELNRTGTPCTKLKLCMGEVSSNVCKLICHLINELKPNN